MFSRFNNLINLILIASKFFIMSFKKFLHYFIKYIFRKKINKYSFLKNYLLDITLINKFYCDNFYYHM
jgi:hypothetical protein